jgi:hypothetical protein
LLESFATERSGETLQVTGDYHEPKEKPT